MPGILAIKLSALGDVVHALPALQAIGAHHRDAHRVLLTTAPYAAWLERSGWFDEVWTIARAPWWDRPAARALSERIIGAGFARIYDLQTSAWSRRLYRRLHRLPAARGLQWSGDAPGCTFQRPPVSGRHRDEFAAMQLALCGIAVPARADLTWAGGDTSAFGLVPPYALLVPGSSPHLARKRWPAASFATLARHLAGCGIQPVVIGGPAERAAGQAIAATAPGALDLTGATGLDDLVALGRGAALAVGNDTGPLHLLWTLDVPIVELFSGHSDPAMFALRGARVRVIHARDLDAVPVAGVIAALGQVARVDKPDDARPALPPTPRGP